MGARLRAFNFSGVKGRIHGDITRYFGSFVGRDFKAWAQISIFILAPYLQQDEMSVWLSLSKVCTRYYTEVCKWLQAVALQVFQMAYCNQYRPDEKRQLEQICVLRVAKCIQDLLKSQRYIYSCTWYSAWSGLDPHQLSIRKGMQVDPMKHTNRCSIHRCESFNSLIRGQNIRQQTSAEPRHCPSLCCDRTPMQHQRVCKSLHNS